MKNKFLYMTLFATFNLVLLDAAMAQLPMFSSPTHLGNAVNSASPDSTAVVSSDGLTLWLSQSDLPSQVFPSIHEATRPSTDVPFGEAINIQGSEPAPRPISLLGSVSGDGLSLYYDSSLPGGNSDLFVVTRSSTADSFDFTDPQPLSELNSSGSDQAPDISKNGLAIGFASTRAGGVGSVDLYLATRETTSDPFGVPINLTSVNSSTLENTPRFTEDMLSLFFYSDRSGGFGGRDIYFSTRDSLDESFGAAMNLGSGINTEYDDAHPYFSEELSTLFFSSDRPGGIPNDPLFATIPGAPGSWDIWQAHVVPEPSSCTIAWIAFAMMSTLLRKRL